MYEKIQRLKLQVFSIFYANNLEIKYPKMLDIRHHEKA